MSKLVDDLAKLGKLGRKLFTGEVSGEELATEAMNSFEGPAKVKCGNAMADGSTCILPMKHEGCVCPGKGQCAGCTFEMPKDAT